MSCNTLTRKGYHKQIVLMKQTDKYNFSRKDRKWLVNQQDMQKISKAG